MANAVVHWELSSHDAERLHQFYTGLFDWRIEKQSFMDYRAVFTGGKGGIDGGMMDVEDSTPPYLTFYVSVEDLQASLSKAESMGAKTVIPPTPIPNVGTFAQITDPEGHLIGLIEPPPDWDEQAGSQAREERDGNPVVHWEIGTANAKRLHGFYTALFDWQVDTNNPHGYGVVHTGATDGIDGGIFQTGNGTPNYLTFYVQVDDVRAALSKAQSLGATTVGAVTPVPGVGTVAHFADPDGHLVSVIQDEVIEVEPA